MSSAAVASLSRKPRAPARRTGRSLKLATSISARWGPAVLPNGEVVQIGKGGTGYLLSGGDLGGIGGELFPMKYAADLGAPPPFIHGHRIPAASISRNQAVPACG